MFFVNYFSAHKYLKWLVLVINLILNAMTKQFSFSAIKTYQEQTKTWRKLKIIYNLLRCTSLCHGDVISDLISIDHNPGFNTGRPTFK